MKYAKNAVQFELLDFSDKEDNTLNHLQNEAASLLSLYTKNLWVVLDKWQVSTPPAITLRMDEEGSLYVEETRQDKAKLDNILNAQQVLRDDFKELEVLHRMLYQLTHGSVVAKERFAVAITSLGGLVLFTK